MITTIRRFANGALLIQRTSREVKDGMDITRKPKPCECVDQECTHCKGECGNAATALLYRVDTEDLTGTAFCEGCSMDAWESGLFLA